MPLLYTHYSHLQSIDLTHSRDKERLPVCTSKRYVRCPTLTGRHVENPFTRFVESRCTQLVRQINIPLIIAQKSFRFARLPSG
jgi:hypothetical protein